MLGQMFTLVNAAMAAGTGESFWFPEQASTVAGGVDYVYDVILWVSAIAFVGIMAAMLILAYRYHNTKVSGPQPSVSHNNTLEVTWTIIPSIIVAVLFYLGAVKFIEMREAPADSYDIYVTGRKWSWSFEYPNGYSDPALHVPKGKNVRLVMQSEDVLHSMFIPAFRTKMDVVPGRFTNLWFNATQTGKFDIFCAEYCGQNHSMMRADVVVHESEEFDKWLADASDFIAKLPPEEAGAKVFKSGGCTQCHSVDGSKGIGPTLKDVYGSKVTLADGSSVVADENFIRESIYEPKAKVVAGFNPVMPTYEGKINAEQMRVLIAYMKSISAQGAKAP